MKTRRECDEVLYTDESVVALSDDEITALKQKASMNPRNRIRLCAHPDTSDKLHEMIIILEKNVHFPPHRHQGKSESVHIIEGIADMIVFNDDGSISQVLPLGVFGSGRNCFCRLNASVYHTLLIRSEFLIFHETINGPFQKDNSQYAPWVPDSSDPEIMKGYFENLNSLVVKF